MVRGTIFEKQRLVFQKRALILCKLQNPTPSAEDYLIDQLPKRLKSRFLKSSIKSIGLSTNLDTLAQWFLFIILAQCTCNPTLFNRLLLWAEKEEADKKSTSEELQRTLKEMDLGVITTLNK